MKMKWRQQMTNNKLEQNYQKLPNNGTQNIPNTYKINPEHFATESFEISSKISSKQTSLQEISQP